MIIEIILEKEGFLCKCWILEILVKVFFELLDIYHKFTHILIVLGDIYKGVDAIEWEQHGCGSSMEATAKANIRQNIVQSAF